MAAVTASVFQREQPQQTSNQGHGGHASKLAPFEAPEPLLEQLGRPCHLTAHSAQLVIVLLDLDGNPKLDRQGSTEASVWFMALPAHSSHHRHIRAEVLCTGRSICLAVA
ncbi:hypothetical protein ABBQ38_000417 [Trebouxia sp. C0009 RCD-2024]